MSTDDDNLYRSPALNYLAVCGAGLAVLVLMLLNQGQSQLLTLLVLAAGVLGVLTRVAIAPLTLLLLIAVSQLMQQLTWVDFRWRWLEQSRAEFVPADLLLAAGLLAYTVGHYRLQSLTRHIVPPDVRLRVLYRYQRPAGLDRALPTVERRRAARLVTPTELVFLLLGLPVWVLLGQVAWHFLARARDVLAREYNVHEWLPWVARLVTLALVLIGGLVLTAAVLRYVRRWRMTADEARLVMQDVLWNETRGEQRWFARWLTWIKVEREQGRREQP
jgi:hypothetical protein